MSNSLDPDQVRHFVGPDMGPNCKGYQQRTQVGKEVLKYHHWIHFVRPDLSPNCLQRLPADDANRQRVTKYFKYKEGKCLWSVNWL